MHKFPGHIACDSASNSEIVVPIIKDDKLYGVIDVDSVKLNTFDDNDRIGLEGKSSHTLFCELIYLPRFLH